MWGAEAWGEAPWGALVDQGGSARPAPTKGPIGLIATATPATALQAHATALVALTATRTPTTTFTVGLEVPDV